MYNYIAVHTSTGSNGAIAVSMHPFTCIYRDLADDHDDVIRGDVAVSLGLSVDPNNPAEGVFIFNAPSTTDLVPEVVL